jgi:ABC-type glycerol-3-phosphate transport system substrate-binding protein
MKPFKYLFLSVVILFALSACGNSPRSDTAGKAAAGTSAVPELSYTSDEVDMPGGLPELMFITYSDFDRKLYCIGNGGEFDHPCEIGSMKLDLSGYTKLFDLDFTPTSIAIDNTDGSVYASVGFSLLQYHADGSLISEYIPPNGSALSVVSLSGVNGVAVNSNNVAGMQLFSFKDGEWDELVTLGKGLFMTLCSGGRDYVCLGNNGSGLIGFSASGEKTELLNWQDVYITNPQSACILPDGKIIILNAGIISELEIKPRAISDSQITLTLSGIGLILEDMPEAIASWNKSHPEIKIVTEDMAPDGNQDEGMLKFITKIAAGEIPDIFYIDDYEGNFPFRSYAKHGLFEDLNPFIENDLELPRAAFLPTLKLAEYDGRLFRMPAEIVVLTAIGERGLIGQFSDSNWTLDNVRMIQEANPDISLLSDFGKNRQSVIDLFTQLSLDSLVNWQTGEVNFDSAEYIDLLKYAASFSEPVKTDTMSQPASNSEHRMPVISTYAIGQHHALKDYREIFRYADPVYRGYPTPDGSRTFVRFDTNFAVSSKCGYKAEAWEFIKFILQYQSNMSDQKFSILQSGMEISRNAALAGKYKMSENADKVPQSDIDEIERLLSSASALWEPDPTIMEIVGEECAAFLARGKTAEETARIIQGRVSMYVNEQR